MARGAYSPPTSVLGPSTLLTSALCWAWTLCGLCRLTCSGSDYRGTANMGANHTKESCLAATEKLASQVCAMPDCVPS
jgi:hypothetical protein